MKYLSLSLPCNQYGYLLLERVRYAGDFRRENTEHYWARLNAIVQGLNEINITHGDLDFGNIMLAQNFDRLVLVDFEEAGEATQERLYEHAQQLGMILQGIHD